MVEIELTLVLAIIVTITLAVIVTFLIILQRRHNQDNRDNENKILELVQRLAKKESQSYQAGVRFTKGDYVQILGEFAILSKYDHIITLSTTSKQPSLDLIGVSEESLDFLELKKKGVTISSNERHIKKLIDEKKVYYKIFDIDLPKNFSMEERILKESIQKERIPKESTPKERTSKESTSKERTSKERILKKVSDLEERLEELKKKK